MAAAAGHGQAGQRIKHYTVRREIGRGSFGRALLAVDTRTSETVVIKQVSIAGMSDKDVKASRKEAVILSRMDHPCIIKGLESFEADGQLCIVTDYAANGDMVKAVERQKGRLFPEETILDWLVQLCLALLYVHKKKLLHRDLKLQNIFLDDRNQIKLGDFGIARVLQHTFECAQTVTGTPYYLSPEVCESKPYNNKADIWSLGICVYEMAAQRRAFDGSSMSSLIRRILRGKFKPLPSSYSKNLRGLVNLMLSRHPGQRPTVGAILQLPFMQPYVEAFVRRCHARGLDVPHVTIADSEPVPPPAPLPKLTSASPPPADPTPGGLVPPARPGHRRQSTEQAGPVPAFQPAGTILITEEASTPAEEDHVEGGDEMRLNVQRFMADGEAEEDDVDATPATPAPGQAAPRVMQGSMRYAAEAAARSLPAHLAGLLDVPREEVANPAARLESMRQCLRTELGDVLFDAIYETILRPGRGDAVYKVCDTVRQVLTARGEAQSPSFSALLSELVQGEHDLFS